VGRVVQRGGMKLAVPGMADVGRIVEMGIVTSLVSTIDISLYSTMLHLVNFWE
jgi:hypothetical protein